MVIRGLSVALVLLLACAPKAKSITLADVGFTGPSGDDDQPEPGETGSSGLSGTSGPSGSSGTSFAISGTVSGLASDATLTLSVNGSTSMIGNGGFTVEGVLVDGVTYSVTVTPPAGFECSVSGGTGTVSGANITGVSVTCSPRLYNITGTITGLANGRTVTVQNGADSITRSGASGNGAFSFATRLAPGASYNISAVAGPNLQCAVMGGMGIVAMADVVASVVCVASFTVRGTVFGAAAGGGSVNGIPLVNGPYELPAAVAGTSYTLTLVQPNNRRCFVISGASGTLNADVTGANISCVDAPRPIVASATVWNYYSRSDSEAECGADDLNCVHQGPRRYFDVPGVATCNALSASDNIVSQSGDHTFEWRCRDDGPNARFESVIVGPMSSLINFAEGKWRSVVVNLTLGGTTRSLLDATGWNDSILGLELGDNFSCASGQDCVFLLRSGERTTPVAISKARRLSFLVEPGAGDLTTTQPTFVTIDGVNGSPAGALWFELGLKADGSTGASRIGFDATQYVTQVVIDHSRFDGLELPIRFRTGQFAEVVVQNTRATNFFKGIEIEGTHHKLRNLELDTNPWNGGANLIVEGLFNSLISNVVMISAYVGIYGDSGFGTSGNVFERIRVSAEKNGVQMSPLARQSLSTFMGVTIANCNQAFEYTLNNGPGVTFVDFLVTDNETGLRIQGNGSEDLLAIHGMTFARNTAGPDFALNQKVRTTDPVSFDDLADACSNLAMLEQCDFFFDGASQLLIEPAEDLYLNVAAGALEIVDNKLSDIFFARKEPSALTTERHLWEVPNVDPDKVCATIPGAKFDNGLCASTYYLHFVELSNDGVGNENGLCEAEETCLFLQNIGGFQGEGSLTTPAKIDDIRFVRYERYYTK
jgi:hypothetical protein